MQKNGTRPPERPRLGAMIKPVSGRCNLSCSYCYYPSSRFNFAPAGGVVAQDSIRPFTAQYMSISPRMPTFSWQGGEPLLAGRDFFEGAVSFQDRCRREHRGVLNTIQTNGILMDIEWAKFLAKHHFLVGISIDGPRGLHNVYRGRGGREVFEQVMRAVKVMREAGTEFNVLVAVTGSNASHPAAVYDFLLDNDLAFVQFIPVAELDEKDGVQPFSVSPSAYRDFLLAILERWLSRDLLRVNIRLFDNVMRAFFGIEPECCEMRDTCYEVVTLEANGELYPCDFFVAEEWRLGNIRTGSLQGAIESEKAREFAQLVRALPSECLRCRWQPICKGGCPKFRHPRFQELAGAPNYVCQAFRAVFERSREAWEKMAETGRGAEVGTKYGILEPVPERRGVRRNDPCPCGSGRKYKHCCMGRLLGF